MRTSASCSCLEAAASISAVHSYVRAVPRTRQVPARRRRGCSPRSQAEVAPAALYGLQLLIPPAFTPREVAAATAAPARGAGPARTGAQRRASAAWQQTAVGIVGITHTPRVMQPTAWC
eukprot:365212-Chlamydomonas_euryale.AAC.6